MHLLHNINLYFSNGKIHLNSFEMYVVVFFTLFDWYKLLMIQYIKLCNHTHHGEPLSPKKWDISVFSLKIVMNIDWKMTFYAYLYAGNWVMVFLCTLHCVF